MSPAIMFCAASRGFHSSHSVLLSANSSFCLIGVGARDFLCSTVALAGYLSFQENLERRTNIARSRGRPQQLRVQPSAAATSAVLGVLSPTVLTDAVWLQGQARRRASSVCRTACAVQRCIPRAQRGRKRASACSVWFRCAVLWSSRLPGPLHINAREGAVYWCRQHGTRGARTSTFLRASRGLARARRLRPVHNR